MILIGIGANLPSKRFGPPVAACNAALTALDEAGIKVSARSRWYSTAPVPASDQPRYVNGVARLETALEAEALLDRLHAIEADFGRVRGTPNEARTLDLDLLDHDGRITEGEFGLQLPHPRLHQRAFVLIPLAEVAPGWRHPVFDASLADLIAALPDAQDPQPIGSGKPR